MFDYMVVFAGCQWLGLKDVGMDCVGLSLLFNNETRNYI